MLKDTRWDPGQTYLHEDSRDLVMIELTTFKWGSGPLTGSGNRKALFDWGSSVISHRLALPVLKH